MCFSRCVYENHRGVCSLNSPRNYPEDAHCSEENEVQLLEDEYRIESEWHQYEYSPDEQAFMSGAINPRRKEHLR